MIPLTDQLRRDYRAVSYSLTSAVVGVIIMRIIVYFVPFSDTYGGELGSNALFSLFTQLVFFLGIPFCIYTFYGRRTPLQTLEYSSVKGFKKYHLLAIPLGICVFVLTVGISSTWHALLRLTGYNMPSAGADKPEFFNGGYFVADILLTALLPAVCEEFLMRGGTLTTSRATLGPVGSMIFGAVAFGLFHQSVRQVFYTMLFGALAVYLTLKLKSIFPAMMMHFTNNFMSVFIDYATSYDWVIGGGFYDVINAFSATRPWALALIFIAVAAIGAGLVFLMIFLRDRTVIQKKIDVIKDSAFDVTNKRVVLFGEFDEKKVDALEMEQQVYGADYKETRYKPTLRDVAIIIALAAVTVFTTVATYVWGFFY